MQRKFLSFIAYSLGLDKPVRSHDYKVFAEHFGLSSLHLHIVYSHVNLVCEIVNG